MFTRDPNPHPHPRPLPAPAPSTRESRPALLRASTLGRHHSRLIVPLGRSSLRASTLGRHNNRTNSLGTKLSQTINTWGDRIKKLKFKEIKFLKILSRSNSCGTKLSVSPYMYTWDTQQQD